jgi:hypothetical protein
MPTAIATPVISSVRTIPCHKKGSAPGIELQSNWYIGAGVAKDTGVAGVQEFRSYRRKSSSAPK